MGLCRYSRKKRRKNKLVGSVLSIQVHEMSEVKRLRSGGVWSSDRAVALMQTGRRWSLGDGVETGWG